MRIIPSNTATAALRRIAFTLVDATDFATPEDITVTGVKVSLSIDGGTPADSTNDIVKVSGTAGEYYIELTQAEANQTAGSVVRGWLTPAGCALAKLEAQFGPAAVFATDVSVDAASVRTALGMASANLDAQLADLPTVAEFEARSLPSADYTVVGDLAPLATSAEIAALDTVVDRIEADTQDLQSRLPAALVGGRIDASVGAMAPDVLTASALAADAVTEIKSGLATAEDLATVAGYLDTEVAAVLATTAKLDTALELDGAGYRFTANALELAPTGGSAPSAAAIRAEIDANSTQLAAIRADTEDLQAQVGAAGAGLTALGDARLANLDAAVSSRSTLDAAGVRTAVGMAAADLDAQLDAIGASSSSAASNATSAASAATAAAAAAESADQKLDGTLAANIKQVNDVTITGTGTEADAWRRVS